VTVLTRAGKLGRDHSQALGGAVASLIVAIVLFTRFSVHEYLTRDQAIYAYGGQRMAHGVPPYSSIFDPKTPMATLVSGVASTLARLTGRDELTTIRLAFFLIALLMVLALYVLALRLWHSVAGAVVAAVVFACFNLIASDALGGPDAKAPGILAAILTMWLVIERRWYWAAFAGSVAFLSWQPLVVYPVMVGVIVLAESIKARKWRPFANTVAGAVTPFIVVTIYFAATHGLGHFFQSAFEFPATGIVRPAYHFNSHMQHIFHMVAAGYGFSGTLLYAGDVILLGLVIAHLIRHRHDLRGAIRNPLVCMVLVTMLAELGYAIYDFEGPPDVYPFLAYPPLGFAGLTALVVRSCASTTLRRATTAAALVAVAVLAGFSCVWFTDSPLHGDGLRAQQADACAVDRILGREPGLYSLGDPIPLVLTRRVNPDRFIYLGESVDLWKIAHTPGGFTGWTQQIQADDPSVLIVQQWRNLYEAQMKAWITANGYHSLYTGEWHLFMRPATMRLARQRGVELTPAPTAYATGLTGRELPATGCR
jgi:hypothetical protein